MSFRSSSLILSPEPSPSKTSACLPGLLAALVETRLPVTLPSPELLSALAPPPPRPSREQPLQAPPPPSGRAQKQDSFRQAYTTFAVQTAEAGADLLIAGGRLFRTSVPIWAQAWGKAGEGLAQRRAPGLFFRLRKGFGD